MSLDALRGLDRLVKKGKKPEKPKKIDYEEADLPRMKVKAQAPDQPVFHDNKMDDGTQIVRTPRTTPAKMVTAVNNVSTGLAMTDPLGAKRETQERRETIVQWMLNGHTHEGNLTSVTQLAETLGVPMETVEKDLVAVKTTFEKFYTENNVRDVTALAYMLMEMKLQDRGRALSLYNIIRGDIQDADESAAALKKATEGKTYKGGGGLTGRDRAAMYSAMLSSLDLANRATSGIDNLIKMSGGFQKLQQVIHAKSVQINNGNGVMATMDNLQELAASTLAAVLPSVRKAKQLNAPPVIELTDEDREIMAIGEKARS